MQLKDIIIGLVAVFLLLVCIAVGLTCITGNPGPSSTPTASPTTLPTATVPSGPYIPPDVSYGPNPSDGAMPTGQAQVTPTPTYSGPAITSATITDHGTDKQTYNRGDTATGFVVIKNTGNTVINNVNMDVSVSKSFAFIGYVNVGQTSYTYTDENIKPGDTGRIEFRTVIPSNYKGVSTAGNFEFAVAVTAEGTSAGSFTQDVTVQ